ncbi:response regulator [Parasediminibacterium sp. JCM 36343]|uniref:response regulator n=1 Tax=Parasediminibacterium sp. JCM 36343 TaxID=3374279 RepID=UPI003978C3DC
MDIKPFILVAEDDIDDKFLFKTVFEEGCSTIGLEFVGNGVELLNYLDKIKTSEIATPYPKLILLDLNMPKMNGKEALKKIKSEPSFSKIPVIIFSTTKNEKEIKNCYDLGADSYLVKPSSYDSFLSTIETIKDYCFNFFKMKHKTLVLE